MKPQKTYFANLNIPDNKRIKIDMDYKEKYEEAYKLYHSEKTTKDQKYVLERLFPELAESEDEMIRKHLIKHFGNKSKEDWNGVPVKSILAWLEKQGEHAKFINGIQVGDKVTRNEDGVLVNLSQLNRVAKKDEKQGENNMGISEATKQELEDNLNKALEKETPESWNKFLDKQDEQKPAKVEPKFKVGDTVTVKTMSCHGKVFKGEPFKIVDIIEDNYVSDDGKTYSISLQDGWELVEQKPADEVDNYDHKEVLQTIINEQNPAWSEEDEKILSNIIKDLVHPWNEYIPDRIEDEIKWLKNKLKSLRPQKNEALPQWRRLPLNGISYAPDSWRVMDVITSTNGANSASVSALVKGDYYVPLFELEKFIKNV